MTETGKNQCAQLKKSIRGDSVWGFRKPLNLDLVVVSPTTRTLQTAEISLGSPLDNGAPPFIANELCRERISESMCDGRRRITELKREFPGVDFSLVVNDEDEMFKHKESEEVCQQRAIEFLQWLCSQPEVHIAVVTHSIFLKTLFRMFAQNVADEDREEIHKHPANAEMRSIMLCAHRNFHDPEADKRHRVVRRKSVDSLWVAGSDQAGAKH